MKEAQASSPRKTPIFELQADSITKIFVVLLLAVGSCYLPPSTSNGTQGQDSNNASPLNSSGVLSKNIVVFIGRGGCCYGHIIAIDKNGNLEYSVGKYAMTPSNSTDANAYLPETFDPNLIEVDNKYPKKKKLISPEILKRLAELIEDEESLSFREKSLVYDDYVDNVYFDNKGMAYGHESKIKSFPLKLQEFIELIHGQVEQYKLPGMA